VADDRGKLRCGGRRVMAMDDERPGDERAAEPTLRKCSDEPEQIGRRPPPRLGAERRAGAFAPGGEITQREFDTARDALIHRTRENARKERERLGGTDWGGGSQGNLPR
jgi:hypothetical protein